MFTEWKNERIERDICHSPKRTHFWAKLPKPPRQLQGTHKIVFGPTYCDTHVHVYRDMLSLLRRSAQDVMQIAHTVSVDETPPNGHYASFDGACVRMGEQ